ncbi:MAG: hypothetical protein K2Q11_11515 [Burkholderiaceae bacterium]|nr:hypothetical protein [Burkholderiaceae bacterium]
MLPAIRNIGGYGTGQAAPDFQIPTTLPGTSMLAVQQTFGGNDAPLSATMTSLELVAFINSEREKDAKQAGVAFPSKGFAKLEHKSFLAKVPEVLGTETSAKFFADLPDSYGRPQPAYIFPKREACLMAMSYSYALQAAVFDHMTALEAKLAQPVQSTAALSRMDILKLAMESEEARLKAAVQGPPYDFLCLCRHGTERYHVCTDCQLVEVIGPPLHHLAAGW